MTSKPEWRGWGRERSNTNNSTNTIGVVQGGLWKQSQKKCRNGMYKIRCEKYF